MGKYIIKVVYSHQIEVDACNDDEAREKAAEQAWQYDPDTTDIEIVSGGAIAKEMEG